MSKRGRIGLLAVLSACGFSAASAQAVPFTVTKPADTADGSCTVTNCSLRDAIAASDAAPGANSITLPAGDYKLSLGPSSGLLVDQSVAITGAGAGRTTIDARGLGRIFDIQGGADFALNGVKLTGGVAPGTSPADGGAIWVENGGAISVTSSILTGNRAVGTAGYGGAIEINSVGAPVTLTRTMFTSNRAGGGGVPGSGGVIDNMTGQPISLSQVTMSDNHSGGGAISGYGFGGAIESSGPVNASHSTLAGNSAGGGGEATGNGGAIHTSSSVSLTASSVRGNTAGGVSGYGFGGGVSADGIVTLSASTVSHNSAGGGSSTSGSDGGGIYAVMAVNATNSTIAANSAGGGANYGFGGGIDEGGTATLQNDTVVGNTALVASGTGGGGGIYGPLSSAGSIIADNNSATGPNCYMAAANSSYDLENGTSCGFTGTGDRNAEPGLRALGNNGGLGQTMALTSVSPALDHGPPTGCPSTDERGVARPQGAACDIGAYELAPPSAQTGSAAIQRSGHVSLAGTATNPDVLAGALSLQWGRTTAYGSHTSTVSIAAGSSAGLSGLISSHLKPGALYHYRAVASNPDGTALGADHLFRAPKQPVLSRLKLRGRQVSYRDSEAAHTTLTLQVRRHHHWVRVARSKHHDRRGANHLRLRKLSHGSYRLIAVAVLPFQPPSRTVTTSFKVR